MLQLHFGSRMVRYSRSMLLLLGTLVAAFALVACGGDDDKDSGDDTGSASATSTAAASSATSSAGATRATGTSAAGTSTATSGGSSSTDTAKGDSTAHAALITEQDLPGTGWTVLSTDEFAGSFLDVEDPELVQAKACDSYVKKVTDAAKKADASRIGRASKSFQKTDALLGASIDIEVAVYKESKVASDLIADAKGAFNSREFEDCFREIIKGSGGEIPADLQFDLKSVKPMTDAPHNGVAQAFDLEMSSAGVKFMLHTEVYAWADKNAIASVTVFGTSDSLNADLVKAAVSKTADKVSKAQ